ncbi:hypothetical protein [Mycobacterium colombiense]|uniref:hypothetical protein n=1 Tax=Mycobacterium colombiense TaxID=339268 RepID=UPI00200B7ECE|nr:hypothetical protein [Mycobacterium colombiense]MCK8645642.1 hypothetical protein [Mycobacterium colombiense]
MGELRRRVGFLGSIGRLDFTDFATVELGGCLVAGTAAGIYLERHTALSARISIAGDVLSLTSALLGVVFAALALVVALLSETYLRMLNETRDGILAFLSPFMLALGIQVTAVVGAVLYRAFAPLLGHGLEIWLFGTLMVLFLMGVLQIVPLGRSVIMHGLARARLREVTDISTEREARRSG